MYGSINNKYCVICLSNDGNIVLSGCKKCKNGNQYVHQECLTTLQNNGYHISKCYICNCEMNDVIITNNNTNILQDFCFRLLFVLFILVISFLLGFLFKMILYTSFINDRTYIEENDYLYYNYPFFEKPLVFLVHEIFGFILFTPFFLCSKYCSR